MPPSDPQTEEAEERKRIDCAMLKNTTKRSEFTANTKIVVENFTAGVRTAVVQWDEFAKKRLDAADETLGTLHPKNRDWFSANKGEIKVLLKRKNDALNTALRYAFSPHLRLRFTAGQA